MDLRNILIQCYYDDSIRKQESNNIPNVRVIGTLIHNYFDFDQLWFDYLKCLSSFKCSAKEDVYWIAYTRMATIVAVIFERPYSEMFTFADSYE